MADDIKNEAADASHELTAEEIEAVSGGLDVGGAINKAANVLADVVNLALGKEIVTTKTSVTTY
jgi:hypothetical protein